MEMGSTCSLRRRYRSGDAQARASRTARCGWQLRQASACDRQRVNMPGAHLPEPVSPRSRSHVRKVSPRNRSHGVAHVNSYNSVETMGLEPTTPCLQIGSGWSLPVVVVVRWREIPGEKDWSSRRRRHFPQSSTVVDRFVGTGVGTDFFGRGVRRVPPRCACSSPPPAPEGPPSAPGAAIDHDTLRPARYRHPSRVYGQVTSNGHLTTSAGSRQYHPVRGRCRAPRSG